MTEFEAQNAGNGIPGLQISNIFRGGGGGGGEWATVKV